MAAILATCGLGLSLVPATTNALDRIEVEAGGGSNVAILGVSVGRDWKRWEINDDWILGLQARRESTCG